MSDEAAQTDGSTPGSGAVADAAMTEPATTTDEERDDDHLRDVEEGAGCAEIWEHLSESREE